MLYCAIEQGNGYTLQEKFLRLRAVHERLSVSDRVPRDLLGYDFVLIDLVSKAWMVQADEHQILSLIPEAISLLSNCDCSAIIRPKAKNTPIGLSKP